MTPDLERYQAAGGARIYRLRLELFPGFWGYSHLILAEGDVLLVDVGSGLDSSNEKLDTLLQRIQTEYGERCAWEDLTHILITHGHIDHFGGLPFVRQRSGARVVVHALDRPVLSHYEDRLTLTGLRLRGFLVESGLDPTEIDSLMDMYLVHKGLFHSVPVDVLYEEGVESVGPLTVTHVPGHCPGQVVLRLGDILLSADHVLEGITPHQAPERLMPYTGLGHYLESLAAIEPWAGEIRLALGGHEGAITALPERIAAIRQLHQERLLLSLDLLDQPHTLAELAHLLFPRASGYHALLALEETGAHLEYLEQRGFLEVSNRGLLEEAREPAPRYQASLEGDELRKLFQLDTATAAERDEHVQF